MWEEMYKLLEDSWNRANRTQKLIRGGAADMTETGKINTLETVEGEVKWFDARKGFGFIVGPEDQDIFVHFSVIDQESGFRTLKDGERVVYSATQGDKGWSATHAKALDRSSVSSTTA